MASFGKKILSAFVDITEEKKSVTVPEETQQHSTPATTRAATADNSEKFKQYFDKLFSDANLPGPDYFEFAKMTQAMSGIADEKLRYSSAFAGLNVQGLDKNKLLETAAAYLKLLETDAANFSSTVDAALAEKVQAKQQEILNKQQRMEQLQREIADLQNQIQLLHAEVKENEEKIENNTGGYTTASENMKQQIALDIEKIKQHIA
ncbi:kinetochore Spc7 family protein [Ferruginibacter profundus]